jgi:hypothetical protein
MHFPDEDRRKQSEEELLDKYGELGCIKICIIRYHRGSSHELPSNLVDTLAAEEAIPKKEAATRAADLGVK